MTIFLLPFDLLVLINALLSFPFRRTTSSVKTLSNKQIKHRINTGATFKYAKEELKTRPWTSEKNGSEGTGDRLYWLDGGVYKPLDTTSWRRIESARAKL